MKNSFIEKYKENMVGIIKAFDLGTFSGSLIVNILSFV